MLQYFGSIFAYDYEVYNLAKAKKLVIIIRVMALLEMLQIH
jgi:hypothetical protein